LNYQDLPLEFKTDKLLQAEKEFLSIKKSVNLGAGLNSMGDNLGRLIDDLKPEIMNIYLKYGNTYDLIINNNSFSGALFLLSNVTNFLFSLNLKDSQSGMWIFRKNILDKIILTSNGIPFSQEIKIEAFKKLKSREIDSSYKKRVRKIKLGMFKDGRGNLKHLIKKRFFCIVYDKYIIIFLSNLDFLLFYGIILTYMNNLD